jgi:hypothetical protein
MLDNMMIHFEGFWQCRLSTDPDPTREQRGTSGYTVALPDEPNFDRVIKTQLDQIEVGKPKAKLREPFPPYQPNGKTRPFGVFVSRVEGAPNKAITDMLTGAQIRLMERPQFELRNQIVGDGINRIAPPIVPFDLQVSCGEEVYLRRADPLDPQRPQAQIWELSPDQFKSRVPIVYRHLSDEVVETIFPGTSSASANAQFIAYFNLRKQWLEAQLSRAKLDPVEAAGYRTRAQMIDDFTSPTGDSSNPGLIENRLGLQCIWDHPIRGIHPVVTPRLAPHVDAERDWRIRFWMGGWDGDLMIGWMVGRLEIPLRALGRPAHHGTGTSTETLSGGIV